MPTRSPVNKPAAYHRFLMLVSLLVLLPFLSFSQLQLVRYDSVIVTSGTVTLALAWAGGLNSPQFSQIDLNGDGLKDLFVFERNFYGMVKTFINQGVEGEAAYRYDPFYRSGFPQMSNWALLADYNCDGREDLFTDVPFGLAVAGLGAVILKVLNLVVGVAIKQFAVEYGRALHTVGLVPRVGRKDIRHPRPDQELFSAATGGVDGRTQYPRGSL